MTDSKEQKTTSSFSYLSNEILSFIEKIKILHNREKEDQYHIMRQYQITSYLSVYYIFLIFHEFVHVE